MTEICRFRGIRILMFHNDHLPPHFHATHSGREVRVHIGTGEVFGQISPAASRHLKRWYLLHRRELRENWHRAMSHLPLNKIAPLDG